MSRRKLGHVTRHKMSKRKNRKVFKRGHKVHQKNYIFAGSMRGGRRL